MPELPAASRFSENGRLYLGAVIISGIGAVAASLYDSFHNPLPLQWYMLAALTLVSGSATVTLPTVGASISVSETFVFASVLLFGPSAGTITVALDGLVISFWMAKRRPEWYRAAFNMAAPAISIWTAAQILFAIAGTTPLFGHELPVNRLIFPLAVFTLVYFGLNSWLIAFAVAFERRLSPYRIWRQNFLWLSLNYFSGASVALLLVAYSSDVDVRFIGVIVPLLLVLYLTFKTTMGRVEDADSHVQQLNRLYLSTIETLAMAIDAKDQVTHGHIRRVQQYAVGLAQHIGVSDPRLLKAIEAAALLHDMGKLAVPEYILNKPGKLTPAEFEKMKTHATVGADILAAIEFPYPVVPIVRHHHENWDGTGYPAGLKGVEIPIGARILSVVDCFDALISDRPYRPRLSDEEALAILLQRRGSMYDPLIVDTFIRVHSQIAPEAIASGLQRLALDEIAGSVQPHIARNSSHTNEATSDDPLTLHQLARALAGQLPASEAAAVIARHVQSSIPHSLCIFFLYDSARDDLVASHIVGERGSIVAELRIGLGQRLSGWVAANRKTIVNSDPTLDLGDAARSGGLHLCSCLSTPLVNNGDLVGVLSIYSSVPDGFNEDHRRVIEAVRQPIAHAFTIPFSFATDVRATHVAELPDLSQLHAFVTATGLASGEPHSRFTLLFIAPRDLSEIRRVHGQPTTNAVLDHLTQQVNRALRVSDMLFKYANEQFVALLNESDSETGAVVRDRILKSVRNNPFLTSGISLDVRIDVTTVSVPHDGSSFTALIGKGHTVPEPVVGAINHSAIH